MPPGLRLVRTTPEFTAESVPAGLCRRHRVAAGVWGRLVVRAGTVALVFEDGGDVFHVVSGGSADIPPDTPHHVEPELDSCFVVEFYELPPAGQT